MRDGETERRRDGETGRRGDDVRGRVLWFGVLSAFGSPLSAFRVSLSFDILVSTFKIRFPSLASVLFEKLPHQVVGGDVHGRLPQEEERGFSAGPGVARSFDPVENHFRLILARTIHATDHARSIVDFHVERRDDRLARAAVGADPVVDRVLH